MPPVAGATIPDSNTAVSSQYALQLGTGTVCTLVISDIDFTYVALGSADFLFFSYSINVIIESIEKPPYLISVKIVDGNVRKL